MKLSISQCNEERRNVRGSGHFGLVALAGVLAVCSPARAASPDAVKPGSPPIAPVHWSFRPIGRPAVPRVRQAGWVRSPIDAFVLSRLEARGLHPSPDADRRTLIRRATFDLTGLPPSPEEIEKFVRDSSPGAFANVVDRLLASPAYGEQWGRHWLDVARYADTAGETADYPVPDAYRYRNYVIDAFNRDKPYNQFLKEQIAGDILAAQGPREKYAEQVVATGFIAISRRFGFDPQNYQHLTIDDTLDTIGRSVLGLSIGCARCHDHKFDPISTRDYYALYGIFASTRYAFSGAEETRRQRDLVPLLPPAEVDALMKPFNEKKVPKPPSIEHAYAVTEAAPKNAHVLKRGDPLTPGDEVPRHFLTVLGGQTVPVGYAGSGRLQLAEWLTASSNPLTLRVIVNRIWQHHFGKPIVPTPNDFGRRGTPPTHPELLDYLAARFSASGWSFKKLHREILLSHVYQTVCTEVGAASSEKSNGSNAVMRDVIGAAARIDPHNDRLWRYPRRRMDAEEIRDSILTVSGSLDRSMGGPHPFPPEETWQFTQHAPFQADYETNRRSVYLMRQRNRRHPFLGLFDGADPNSSTAERRTTTVPTQALFFMNDPFVHRESENFARRLLRDGPDDAARVRSAVALCYGRSPTGTEIRKAIRYVDLFRQDAASSGAAPDAAAKAGWASYARILFSSNEFMYVE